MRTQLDRLLESLNGSLIHDVAIDQHDSKPSRISFVLNGEHMSFNLHSLPDFLERYHSLIADGVVGIEATAFNYRHGDKIAFIKKAASLGLRLKSIPSNHVARYRKDNGLQKDMTVKDAEILSKAREEDPQRWSPYTGARPEAAIMQFDADIGRTIVAYRHSEGRFDPGWLVGLPPALSVPSEIVEIIVDKKTKDYRNTVAPFAFLAQQSLERFRPSTLKRLIEVKKNVYERVARMYDKRYKGRNQGGLEGVQGSGGVFASLFFHELVRGHINRSLGLSHKAGKPSQLKALGGDESKWRGVEHDAMRKARKAVRWIWWRAVEQFDPAIAAEERRDHASQALTSRLPAAISL